MKFAKFVEDGVKEMLRTETSPPIVINSRILHGIMGIVDEAGELNTIAKAKIYYNKEIDMVNLKEELGDLWWYFRLLLDEIAVIENSTPAQVFESIAEMNKAKLHERYPEKYSDKAATNRDLNRERKELESH